MISDKLYTFAKSFFPKAPFLVPYWDFQELGVIMKFFLKGSQSKENELTQVEEEVSNMLGVKYCLATNLGRSALELGLRALGLKEGSEVLVSSFICRGAVLPILRIGCVPVFVDIDNGFNPDPESVKENISPKTRAIIISHLGGKPAQVEELINIAKDYGLFVIDDAAQSFGAKYKDKFVGTWGDIGIFSFGMGKNLMATAGGMLVTDSRVLFEKAREIKLDDENRFKVLKRAINKTIKHRYRRLTLPFILLKEKLSYLKRKSSCSVPYSLRRMSALDASLLSLQLKKKDEIINRRRMNAQIFNLVLEGVPNLHLPEYSDGHIFTKYPILIDGRRPIDSRKRGQVLLELARFLRKKGVEPEWSYFPLHLQKGFERFKKRGLPKAESLWWKVLILPVNPFLSKETIKYVGAAVKEFLEERSGIS